jgi:hypothetical protein
MVHQNSPYKIKKIYKKLIDRKLLNVQWSIKEKEEIKKRKQKESWHPSKITKPRSTTTHDYNSPTQNKLHLPLIKRIRVAKFLTRYHFQERSFTISTKYSIDEDPPTKIKSFQKF